MLDKLERVEDDLDRLIERRSKERDKANELEELWRRSEQAQRERARLERLAAWVEHHTLMQALHQDLAEEHREQVRKLMEATKEKNEEDGNDECRNRTASVGGCPGSCG